jgi:putative acetyltransferase
VNVLPDLHRTNLFLLDLLGSVETHPDCIVARSPTNPGYYHGNLLLLPAPPVAIAPWLERFEELFGPSVEHRCLSWIGGPCTPEVLAEAGSLGLLQDGGVALALETTPDVPPVPDLDWSIRPLEREADWESIGKLNRACDPAEESGLPDYRRFKERIRAATHEWIRRGHAVWWGGFQGERLVAQCGMVICEGGLARFQAVETHPSFRRRGACSSLVAHVATHALTQLGARRVLLEADDTGPAVRLYQRLGFERDVTLHSLIRPSEPLQVLAEAPGQQADVRSLLRAAFPTEGEADLVDALRLQPGVISLVAVQSGAVVGHALFTPVDVAEHLGSDDESRWQAVALGPLAVRPDRQRQGIGSQLISAGLEICLAAGHDACFVLGDPGYYPRVGFEPAPPKGLRCKWPVPDDVFMVKELAAGALRGRGGLVAYDPAFDQV